MIGAVGEMWARAIVQLPAGSREQQQAWLMAARVPLAVRVVGGDEGSTHFMWWLGGQPLHCMPRDQATGEVAPTPGEGVVWEPMSGAPTLGLPDTEFSETFKRVGL